MWLVHTVFTFISYTVLCSQWRKGLGPAVSMFLARSDIPASDSVQTFKSNKVNR